MEKGMTELQVNHLEIMARPWAAAKAREVAGIAVDHVLTRTGATHFDPAVIRQMEAHMERWLAAWLKNCTVEFVGEYDRAVNERMLQLERMLNDYVTATLNPPFIKL